MKVKSVDIITLGCSKNWVDSEKILTAIAEAGIKVRHNPENPSADWVLVNTCGFIQDAKQESIDTILELALLKQKKIIKRIMVFGCLSQRYQKELAEELSEVDAFYGVDDFEQILKSILPVKKIQPLSHRLVTTPKHYAYLKIAEGCNRKCTFCAIPKIRGKYRSESIDLLTEEAKYLAAQGVKELCLVAQDTTNYGKDRYGKKNIASLMEALSIIDGIEWIRLQYAYPAQFPADLITQMAENPKVCKYLDIPFQHISDSVLSRMKRGIDKRSTYKLIEKLRKNIPDLALRTTLIVGFPGESKKDYDELKNFVKEVRFERLGVFMYSEEEGTPAAKFRDNVSSRTKKERMEEIMAIQQEISYEVNNSRVGQSVKVLIDRVEGKYFVGRTQWDAPEVDNEVLMPLNEKIKIGDFYNVKIVSAEAFEMFGKLV